MSNNLDRYVQLPKSSRLEFLLCAAFNLTIEFRGLERLSDGEARMPAKGFNELQHKLLSQAAKELSDEDRYPDDLFFTMLTETAELNGLSAVLQSALARAAAKCGF